MVVVGIETTLSEMASNRIGADRLGLENPDEGERAWTKPPMPIDWTERLWPMGS